MKNVSLENEITITVPDWSASHIFYDTEKVLDYFYYGVPAKKRDGLTKENASDQMVVDFKEHGNDYVVAVCYIGYVDGISTYDISVNPQWDFPYDYMEILNTVGRFRSLKDGYEKTKRKLSFAGVEADILKQINSHVPVWEHQSN